MFKTAAFDAKTDSERRDLQRQAELHYGVWQRPWLYRWPEQAHVPSDERENRNQERASAFRGLLNDMNPPYRADMERAIRLLTPEERKK